MRPVVNLQSVEQKLLLLALLFVIGGSIVANLFAWDVKWQIPLIYAVLYVLLSVVVEVRDRQAPTASTHYRTSDDFFLSFARFVRTAERHVYTSYVRNTPPPSFQSPAAQQYFRLRQTGLVATPAPHSTASLVSPTRSPEGARCACGCESTTRKCAILATTTPAW